jgi:hypothetical protein
MPVGVRRRQRDEEDDADADREEGESLLDQVKVPEVVDERVRLEVGEQNNWRRLNGALS